jgi:cold shock CspA family protein
MKEERKTGIVSSAVKKGYAFVTSGGEDFYLSREQVALHGIHRGDQVSFVALDGGKKTKRAVQIEKIRRPSLVSKDGEDYLAAYARSVKVPEPYEKVVRIFNRYFTPAE